MGILNKLWSKPWNAEEAKKRAEADKVLNDAHIRAAEIRAKLTPVQEVAQKHGGPEEDYYNLYSQANQHAAALAQHSHLGGGLPSWFQQTGTSIAPTATGVYPGHYQAGTALPSTHIYQGPQAMSWPVLGSTHRDIFFIALKGIEEAAMSAKNRADNFRYDDLALAIQDMRYFDPQRVSLLGLTSFCLSNLMEVEPIVVLLEGHGMTVIDE